jgi:hypothetical protein
MNIVTELENPWNDDKEHFSIPLHRYGDRFFIREITEANSGQEFPQRLDGATYGEIHILMKDEYSVEIVAARLVEIADSLMLMLEGLKTKRKLERSEDGSQTV